MDVDKITTTYIHLRFSNHLAKNPTFTPTMSMLFLVGITYEPVLGARGTTKLNSGDSPLLYRFSNHIAIPPSSSTLRLKRALVLLPPFHPWTQESHFPLEWSLHYL